MRSLAGTTVRRSCRPDGLLFTASARLLYDESGACGLCFPIYRVLDSCGSCRNGVAAPATMTCSAEKRYRSLVNAYSGIGLRYVWRLCCLGRYTTIYLDSNTRKNFWARWLNIR